MSVCGFKEKRTSVDACEPFGSPGLEGMKASWNLYCTPYHFFPVLLVRYKEDPIVTGRHSRGIQTNFSY